MKKTSLFITCILVLSILLVACSTPAPAPAATPAPQPSAAAPSAPTAAPAAPAQPAAAPAAPAPTATAPAAPPPVAFAYPMDKKNVTLKVYAPGIGYSATVANQSECYFHQKLADMTGVTLEWVFAPVGTDGTQFYNLMIASADLPDIIYDGRVTTNNKTYLEDGVIIDLTENLERWSPNYFALCMNDDSFNKGTKNDDSQYYGYHFVRETPWLRVWQGPAIRNDWLKAENLTPPVTIDDWTNVFSKLSSKYGATWSATYGSTTNMFVGAYGINRNYFLENNEIKYGPAMSAYKEYLMKMKEWYDAGYIDKDFAAIDGPGLTTKIVNDKVLASIVSGGSLTGYLEQIKAKGSTAEWVGVQYARLNANDEVKFAQNENVIQTAVAAITTACKDVETAMRFCDYGYSPEGFLYWNYGEEGLSYNMVNGKPVFADIIMKAPDINNAVTMYIGTRGSGFAMQAESMYKQKTDTRALAAIDVWADKNMAFKYLVPNITPTYEEQQATASLQTAITTYVDEMHFKFIMGQESFDKFDAYVAQINSMGLDKVLAAKNAQLQRYNAR